MMRTQHGHISGDMYSALDNAQLLAYNFELCMQVERRKRGRMFRGVKIWNERHADGGGDGYTLSGNHVKHTRKERDIKYSRTH